MLPEGGALVPQIPKNGVYTGCELALAGEPPGQSVGIAVGIASAADCKRCLERQRVGNREREGYAEQKT